MSDLPDFIPVEQVSGAPPASDGLPDFIPLEMVSDAPSEGSFMGSVWDSAKQFGAGAIEGTAGFVDLLDEVNPLRPGGPRLFGLNENVQNQGSGQIAQTIKPFLPEEDENYRYARTIGEFVGPGGVLRAGGKKAATHGASVLQNALAKAKPIAQDTTAAVGAQVAEDATGDDTIAPIVGALAPSLLASSARSGAKKLSTIANKAGAQAEKKAFGSTYSFVKRANQKAPLIFDEIEGKYKDPVAESIASFRAAGGGKNLDPDSLINDLRGQIEDVTKRIDSEIGRAAVREKGGFEIEWDLTDDYLSTLGSSRDDAAEKVASELKEKIGARVKEQGIRRAQMEKEDLGEAIKPLAWGSDAGNEITANVYKRMRADLRRSIEKQYERTTGQSANNLRDLNSEFGKRKGLEAMFNRLRDLEASQDSSSKLIQTIKTTGGYGTLGALGFAAGGGVPGAVASVAAAKALESPNVRLKIADTLRGRPVQGTLEALASGTSAAGRVGALAGVRALEGQDARSADSQFPNERQRQVESQQVIPSPQRDGKLSPSQEIVDPIFDLPVQESVFSQPTSAQRDTRTSVFDGGIDMEVRDVEALIDQDPIDAAIYEVESSRNPKAKNPNSTAAGGFQLIKQMQRKLGVEDPYDLEQNYRGYRKLREDHERMFGSDPAAIYGAHFLGAGLLKKYLNGDPVTPRQQTYIDEFEKKALPRFMRIYNRIAGQGNEVLA